MFRYMSDEYCCDPTLITPLRMSAEKPIIENTIEEHFAYKLVSRFLMSLIR